MWEKIKKAIAWIGGGLIAVLFFILGIKNKRIRKTEEKLEEAEREIAIAEEVHETEEAMAEISERTEEKAEVRIADIKAETIEKLSEDVPEADIAKRYNDEVRKWNEGE